MPSITCPSCKGSGLDTSGDEPTSNCTRCGGTNTRGSGFFGGNNGKRGTGRIQVSSEPCSSCDGRGYKIQRAIQSQYAEYAARMPSNQIPESYFYNRKFECYSCNGTGRRG